MVKLVFLCQRRPDVTHEQYVEMLLRGHVPLALAHHPTLRRYVVNVVESTRGPLRILDSATARARIVEISDRHNLHVDPDALVEDLPVGVRQRVEIIKTLYRRSNLLILDGDVLDATTTIQKIMVEGKIVYENPWEKSQ